MHAMTQMMHGPRNTPPMMAGSRPSGPIDGWHVYPLKAVRKGSQVTRTRDGINIRLAASCFADCRDFRAGRTKA